MIALTCYTCHEQLEAPASLAGQAIKCPRCGTLNKISSPPKMPLPENSQSLEKAAKAAQAAKKHTSNGILRIWKKTPLAFRSGLLATLGVMTALYIGYKFITPTSNNHQISGVQQCKAILAKEGLFPYGTRQTGVLRARQLMYIEFRPNANFDHPALNVWFDENLEFVGVSASWKGGGDGSPLILSSNNSDQEFMQNYSVSASFSKLIGTHSTFDFLGKGVFHIDPETELDTTNTQINNWKIVTYRLSSTDTNYKYPVYVYVATAHNW